MPIYPVAYLAVLLGGCGYAILRGGSPERYGAVIVLAGMVFANLAGLYSGRVLLSTDMLDLLVDAVEAASLIVLACMANRYWPLWAAMLQLDTVFTHIVMFADATPPFSYGLALRVFAFPLPVLIAAGTWRYQERKTRLVG